MQQLEDFANNNWYSIHNPITEEMITTGQNIPDELADDDVYYNRSSNDNKTRPMRDFHNLFVKKMLITKTAAKGNTLIDYAVGKAGDFPKWIDAKLSFVFGIDLLEYYLSYLYHNFLIYNNKEVIQLIYLDYYVQLMFFPMLPLYI